MGKIKSNHSNIKNAIIAFLVPLPSIFFYLSFLRHYSDSHHSFASLWSWCYHHPLLLANVLFFFNVNVLFWVIGQLQSSHWMIDPYWTVIPVMFVHYFAMHPLANYNVWRSNMAIVLTWIWSIRLSHNYFRRENWQWGAREDWRFTDMSKQYGRHWWWISFFAVYLAQQVFLVGLCLPFFTIHTVDAPISLWDFSSMAFCLTGIIVAYYADTQLHAYVTKNAELKASGKPSLPILEYGLWRYSRHPNYFGEQLFWWGLGIMAWSLGHGWTVLGALVNTLCLAYVTVLVEERMLKQPFRAEAYRQYQKMTSVWIPWLKLESKDKTN